MDITHNSDRFNIRKDDELNTTLDTNPNTTFDTDMYSQGEEDSHDDLLDDLLASPVQQRQAIGAIASPLTGNHQQHDELMLDDLLASPVQQPSVQSPSYVQETPVSAASADTLDDLLASPVQQQHQMPSPPQMNPFSVNKAAATSVEQRTTTQQPQFSSHEDTSMTDISAVLKQPQFPSKKSKKAVQSTSTTSLPPRPPTSSTFKFNNTNTTSPQKRWMHSPRGSWIENPNFHKKQSPKAQDRKAQYLKKRRSSTVPLESGVAERPTQCWTNRMSINQMDSAPTFATSTSSKRKRKCTVPLDCAAARPTKSWLAKYPKHSRDEDCPRMDERSRKKPRRLHPNYLPSGQQNHDSDSSLVFPRPKRLHKFTHPELGVTIAGKTTQAWSLKQMDRQKTSQVICPYFTGQRGEFLTTPNGQYSIYGNKRARFR